MTVSSSYGARAGNNYPDSGKKRDCVICYKIKRGSVVLTRATVWPSTRNPAGEPPEYDFMCFGCQFSEEDERV